MSTKNIQNNESRQSGDVRVNGGISCRMAYFEKKFFYESPAHPYAVCRQALFNVHTLFEHTTVAFYGSSNPGKETALKEFYAYFFEYANKYEKEKPFEVMLKLKACIEILKLFTKTKTKNGRSVSHGLTELEVLFDVSSSPVGAKINSLLIGSWKVTSGFCSHASETFSESNFVILYLMVANASAMGWSHLNFDPKLQDYRILNGPWGKEHREVLADELSFENATYSLKTIG